MIVLLYFMIGYGNLFFEFILAATCLTTLLGVETLNAIILFI